MSPVKMNLLPTAISELFAQVSETGKITLADRYGMMAAILGYGSTTTDEDLQCIDRLLRGLVRGRIQVVDDLSALR